MSRVWIAGARTFAQEAADYARDAGLYPAGFLDPSEDSDEGRSIDGLPVLALDEPPRDPTDLAMVGTGDGDRRDVVARLERAGWTLRGLVHPTAHVAGSARIAPTALLAPGVVVGAEVTAGDHVVVGRGALVGHHTDLGAHCTLGPGANVAGNAVLEEGAQVHMAAAVRNHLRIGAWSRVAMGAVVVSDVPAGVEVRGVPAKESGPAV